MMSIETRPSIEAATMIAIDHDRPEPVPGQQRGYWRLIEHAGERRDRDPQLAGDAPTVIHIAADAPALELLDRLRSDGGALASALFGAMPEEPVAMPGSPGGRKTMTEDTNHLSELDDPARCVVCGVDIYHSWPPACTDCAPAYPDALLKACVESFDYAVGLRTGDVIRFAECTIRGEWAHLTIGESSLYAGALITTLAAPLDRGIDVRVVDIVWVAAAPDGS